MAGGQSDGHEENDVGPGKTHNHEKDEQVVFDNQYNETRSLRSTSGWGPLTSSFVPSALIGKVY